jgi:hypothetical protein
MLSRMQLLTPLITIVGQFVLRLGHPPLLKVFPVLP